MRKRKLRKGMQAKMSILQLEDAKSHLKVFHSEDDVELQGFLDAAEGLVARYIRCDLLVDFPEGLPPGIRLAVLTLVARFDADREALEMDGLPDMVKIVLADFRVFS